jgi:hypothetical protein
MNPTLAIINSKDRASGTAGDFIYNFQYTGLTRISRYRLNKIVIPYSWYNTPDQVILMTVNGGGPILVDIDAGSYNAQTLATYMQNKLTSASPQPFTVIYNQSQNTYTISLVSPHIFTLSFTYPTLYQNLGVQMGFGTDTPNQNSTTSTFAVNLNMTNSVYLASSSLRLYAQSYFQKVQYNVVQHVPVNVNSFNFITWQNSTDTFFLCNEHSSITNFDFQLIDDYGNPIDFRGQDITIELEFQ